MPVFVVFVSHAYIRTHVLELAPLESPLLLTL